MLSFSFVGLSLFRFDAAKLLELLFQLPHVELAVWALAPVPIEVCARKTTGRPTGVPDLAS